MYSVLAPESSSSKVIYNRVNVAKTGYIAITQSNVSARSMSTELCNSAKNVIAREGLSANKTYYYPVKKGVYYIKTSAVNGIWSKLKYSFVTDIKMSNNKVKEVYTYGNATLYFKFKAAKTGSMKLYNTSEYGSDFTLCNSKKKALTRDSFLSRSNITYTVKKGTTYLIKVDDTIGEHIKIKYKISGVSVKKNTKKSKAVTLKKKKTIKGVTIVGKRTSYWYKFKVTKAKKLNIATKFAGTGKCSITVYRGSKRIHTYNNVDSRTKKLYTTGKLSKGTYYLKITPDKLSAVSYSLKLK